MPRRWKILIAVGLAIAAADQWTKFLAVEHLTPALSSKDGTLARIAEFYGDIRHPCRAAYCGTVDVIDGFWAFRYVENPGAAWGLLAGASESVRVPFFLVVSFGALAFIGLYFRKLNDAQHLLVISLSLVFGGAVGNLIDRLHLSYVIDFIDWYAGSYHWPTFNVADSAISVGVGMLLVDMLLSREPSTAREPAAAAPQDPS